MTVVGVLKGVARGKLGSLRRLKMTGVGAER